MNECDFQCKSEKDREQEGGTRKRYVVRKNVYMLVISFSAEVRGDLDSEILEKDSIY